LQETKLLGKLPFHPDILPIVEEIKEKYKIPEISPFFEAKILEHPTPAGCPYRGLRTSPASVHGSRASPKPLN
jgi:hypothetical protein